MTLKTLIPLLFLLQLTYSIDFLPNPGPVIGILTSPRSGIHSSESEIKMTNYEFLLSGGQVNIIPIPWDLETKRFNQLLNSVNGILLTGGDSRLWTEDEEGNRAFSPYQRTVNYLMYHVMKKNKSGVYFPVWAICEGYEAVAIALTKDTSVLDTFKHNNRYEPITFTDKAQRSKMFQHYSKEDFIFAEKNPSVYYKHEYGLNTSVPRLYPALGEDQWVITSINEDENGKEFINSMEMKDFPVFIHMFHPERALHDALYQKNFESASQVVSIASKMAQAFLTEAKKNDNGFASLTLQKGLAIENFEKEQEYYVFTRDSFKEQWLSVYSDVVDWFIWGVLGLIAIGMISCVVWMYIEKEKREHPKINYERIDAVRI